MFRIATPQLRVQCKIVVDVKIVLNVWISTRAVNVLLRVSLSNSRVYVVVLRRRGRTREEAAARNKEERKLMHVHNYAPLLQIDVLRLLREKYAEAHFSLAL